VVISHKLIPVLKSKKMGQKILEIGPRWHKSKEGTPTMGGLAFIAAAVIVCILACIACAIFGDIKEALPFVYVLLYGVLNGLIGIVDDSAKLRKKRNEGLTARQKYLLQLGAATLFLLLMSGTGIINTVLYIPFLGVAWDFGFFYYVIALLLLTGMVNSVNLTDGIDGLASTVTLVVFGFFAFVGINYLDPSVTLISAALIGGMLGFLVYNLHPAKVFMGDTGSLFLGGAVAGAAFLINEPMLVLLIGGVYVMEAVSVILQVGSFKLRQKRIFKMAPIHHHFEKCGWREGTIVTVFSLVTVLLCVIAWFGL
jgi:phospho-N-acetylmuramoyl-pentapeptide-transferase